MLAVARYGTSDLDRAKTFYDALAELLSARRVVDRPEVIGYQGAQGAMFLVGRPFEGRASTGNGTQLSFPAASRSIVDDVHAIALAMGGKCEGPPGVRQNGSYAAYFRDPDGNKLMVFFRGT